MEKRTKKKKAPRQDWKPHWSLRILKSLLGVAFSVLKIALGAAATVSIIVGICLLVVAGSVGDYLDEEILSKIETEDSESRDMDLNSNVFYVDGNGDIQKLQNIYAVNNREWANYEDIPEDLIHAAVAIEDKRFFEHQGVDWITTVKACFFMSFGNGDRGGSTITQQLIKNVTDNWDVTVQRKVQEIFTALEYERRYSKEEIMEWYLNEIYMGNRTNGVRMAAAIYFGKELESLTLAECASLISITNNPSLYNPYRENLDKGGMNGRERNRERQMDTLDEMLAQGWITQAEYDEAVAQELVFKRGIAPEDKMIRCPNEDCGYKGIVKTLIVGESGTDHYCPNCETKISIGEDASQEVYSYYVDTLLEDVAADLAKKDGVELTDSTMRFYKQKIASSGYNIYACIDMDVQNALDAIYQDLDQIPAVRSGQQPQSAMVIIDNRTGDIVALTGGVGKDKVHDGQNRAVDSVLQTGSSIKPLTVYGPAFESGVASPATVVKDLPQNYDNGSGWPKNDNRRYSYARTIYSGIMSSVNAVAVNTLQMVGTSYSYNFAKEKLGLTSLIDSFIRYDGEVMSDDDYAPLALGAQTKGLTVREMASAFAVFPNGGNYREGRTYTKVYDNKGNLVLDNTQDTWEAFSPKTVNYMNLCLAAAVGGTGGNARISGQNVYGKTGTTSSNRDRWFCGYTAHYTAAVWFGFDTPEVVNLIMGNGNNPAAILFSKVLSKVHNGLPKVDLINYDPLLWVSMCLDSGKMVTEACLHDVRTIDGIKRYDSARVYREDYPSQYCDKHILVDYCVTGGGVCNEYCKLFADEKENTGTEVKIEKKSLVKMTQKEVAELLKAKPGGLLPEYLRDDYIYLINENGTDAVFKGIEGKLEQEVDAPYLVCPLHNKEAWEEYQESIKPTEPETQPDTETDTESDTESDTETDTESDTESDTNTEEDDGAVG